MIKPNHLAIAAALGTPGLTQIEIAKLTGVHQNTVNRVAKKLKAISNAEQFKDSYRVLLNERLPAKKRVDVLESVAKKANSNPFAALRAVEYADSISGVSPKQEVPPDQRQQPPALFSLPPGSDISIRIKPTQPVIDVSNTYTDESKND